MRKMTNGLFISLLMLNALRLVVARWSETEQNRLHFPSYFSSSRCTNAFLFESRFSLPTSSRVLRLLFGELLKSTLILRPLEMTMSSNRSRSLAADHFAI